MDKMQAATSGITSELTEEELRVKNEFPLHWMVWQNDRFGLHDLLSKSTEKINFMDRRGCTPLMLAVRLNHTDCVDVLLEWGASVLVTYNGWTVVHEATSIGNLELLTKLLIKQYSERSQITRQRIPQMLRKLKDTPDFYVEMKWEFNSSFLPPLFSRMFPNDVCKIYKQGANVRIDITLIGFDGGISQRGERSLIFKGNDQYWTFVELDHDNLLVDIEKRRIDEPEKVITEKMIQHEAKWRLKEPIVTTFIDMTKVNFERNKTGIWGWRQYRTENVGPHYCKVFTASNVDLVTRTRREHLQKKSAADGEPETSEKDYKNDMTIDKYMNTHLSGDPKEKDIGRKVDQIIKIRKIKAMLWLCEDYPLNLQEQIVPVLDLVASSSSHFRKLKDFIELHLPSGFPVKIEIPLFQVVNASITFSNIFAMEKEVKGVTTINGSDKPSCFVDDSVFDIPSSYVRRDALHDNGSEFSRVLWTNEDAFEREVQELQFESWAAEQDSQELGLSVKYERDLQRAIEESLRDNRDTDAPQPDASFVSDLYESGNIVYTDAELEDVIALSKREAEEQERNVQDEEVEILKEVIRRSLVEQ